ncbi:MAG: hypothetical protein LBE36_13005 [Flavobacteriaceae bacterium]|nr:hypothetical protein [Flavobacteriaceae bacterium]
MKHDRSFFKESIKSWKDNRSNNKDGDSVAWCHGSAGIGLGRLLFEQYHEDSRINEELTMVRDNILNILDGTNSQCICHGDLGNLEILLAIAYRNKDDDTLNIVNNYLKFLCNEFLENKNFIYGTEGKTDILGLFLGKAGFGYQLLRFCDWENVPSVMCLEIPNNLNKILHEKTIF